MTELILTATVAGTIALFIRYRISHPHARQRRRCDNGGAHHFIEITPAPMVSSEQMKHLDPALTLGWGLMNQKAATHKACEWCGAIWLPPEEEWVRLHDVESDHDWGRTKTLEEIADWPENVISLTDERRYA